MVKTELICIGTELLAGKTNTNACFIGERLASVGLDLSFITSVGDTLADMRHALETAVSRSRIVIVTGGLGPTFDDLTRDAAAAVTGRPLVIDAAALAGIESYFICRGIPMPPANRSQALLVDGATLLPNPVGMAPGQMIECGAARLFLLPGPPAEMQAMFEASVFPAIRQFETRKKKSFSLHIAGIPESEVDRRIRPIVEGERALEKDSVSFTILAHHIVDIRVSVWDADEMLVDENLRVLKHALSAALGDAIYGEDAETLESVVGALLARRRATLAVAESCTGGLVCQRITAVPGSSLYFTQGVVAYANEAKQSLLGVPLQTIEQFGAVSEETAHAMAAGARARAGTDYALSLTGIAGPTDGTAEKPTGLVYIGLAARKFTKVMRCQFPGNRLDIRERAADAALDMLRRELLAAAPVHTQR